MNALVSVEAFIVDEKWSQIDVKNIQFSNGDWVSGNPALPKGHMTLTGISQPFNVFCPSNVSRGWDMHFKVQKGDEHPLGGRKRGTKRVLQGHTKQLWLFGEIWQALIYPVEQESRVITWICFKSIIATFIPNYITKSSVKCTYSCD